MSILTDLITAGRTMLTRKRPLPPTETQALNSHLYDVADWKDTLDKSSMMQHLTENLTKEGFGQAPELMQDLHGVFHKIDPRVHAEAQMADEFKANRAVVESMLSQPEVQNLRSQTIGDKYGSAFAMQKMAGTVKETLDRVQAMQEQALEEQKQADADAEQAQQDLAEALTAAQEALDSVDPNADPNDPNHDPNGGCSPGGVQRLFDAAQAAIDAAEAAQVEVDNARSRGARATKKAIAAKAAETEEALAEELALAAAFGADPGEVKKMSVEERTALAERLRSNRLAAFVKLLGAFKTVQKAESRKRVINAGSEVHGVTLGADWNRVTVGELLNFADPTLELLMLKRWVDRQLIVNDVRGKENLGQGPIIFVGDESGSMTDKRVSGGTREAWMKALALAMLEQAKHRNRDFIYIGFASEHQQRMVRFPQGKVTLDLVLEMTEVMLGGGTNYERPLAMALQEIENYANAGKSRPDIVFVTDDAYRRIADPFMDKWRALKDRASIKCYGISVGVKSSGALEQICDSVQDIDDMVNDDPRAMGELFRTI